MYSSFKVDKKGKLIVEYRIWETGLFQSMQYAWKPDEKGCYCHPAADKQDEESIKK